MSKFNVYLGKKMIDSVFYSEAALGYVSAKEAAEMVRHSLVAHDGYDPGIRVVRARANRNAP